MPTDTTHLGDRDPGADPADEWDRETTPGQRLATAMRTAAAARRDIVVLSETCVYLAGPMTGYIEFNFPAFQAAARELRHMGFVEVLHTGHGTPPSPTEAKPWEAYLREALRYMLSADAVVALPGWRESRGARLEIYVALELDMPVVEYPDLRPVESLADEVEVRTFGGQLVHVEPHPWSHLNVRDPFAPEDPKGFDGSHVTEDTVTIAGVEFDTSEDPEQ